MIKIDVSLHKDYLTKKLKYPEHLVLYINTKEHLYIFKDVEDYNNNAEFRSKNQNEFIHIDEEIYNYFERIDKLNKILKND